MKPLMITAMASGEGKTVMTCALLQALKMRGISVESCKCGPDYIDPMFHRKVLGIPSDNLDLFLQGRAAVHERLQERRAQMMLVEGAMGYYDGRGRSDEGSAWELSLQERIPALLVIRPKGNSLTLAAQVKGLMTFRENQMLRGILLNNCRKSLYLHLKRILEQETGLPVLGYLPPMEEASLESRHLGLVTEMEVPGFLSKIRKVAQQMEESVDLDAILSLADTDRKNGCTDNPLPEPDGTTTENANCVSVRTTTEEADRAPVCKIAVARDEAFCFYYESSLQALRKCGAELTFFSPLRDKSLPECDGLYLGGGYPELYAGALEKNETMRESIRHALLAGMPAIAECGGFLYLQKSLEDEKRQTCSMVGFLPGAGFRTSSLVRFGYHTLHPKGDSMLFRGGEQIPVHEFHYWDCTDNGSDLISVKENGKQWECGYVSGTLYAAFPHLHLGAELPLAQRFVHAAAACHLVPGRESFTGGI
ncbi:MAG: cobyrinate a,c-diamide synthase [Lachnospiraceae bacterium]|nr:cobyrinate a,c-diamide synthase [Lachnospiraceae bacterium]